MARRPRPRKPASRPQARGSGAPRHARPRKSAPAPAPAPRPPAPAPWRLLRPAASDHAWLTHALDVPAQRPVVGLLEYEWLLTNGTGAFAMGTLGGVNTRRYHGLLIASTRPPVGRILALNQVLEQVVLTRPGAAPQTIDFSSLLFRDPGGHHVLSPAGQAHLRRFEKGLFCRWTLVAGDVEVVRELYLHWQDQAATLRYVVRRPSASGAAPASGVLRLAPMFALRDYHALTRRDQGGAFRTQARPDGLTVHRDGFAVTCAAGAEGRPGVWRGQADQWWYNVHYPAEAERGQDCFEDHFVPGAFELPLNPVGETRATFSAALGDRPADDEGWTIDDRAADLTDLACRPFLAARPPAVSGATAPGVEAGVQARALAIAASDFLARRSWGGQRYTTLLAGYPWFADWGRDTFIALPGLLLATERFEEARLALTLYSQVLRDGLVPNRFDDYDESAAHYNAVDSSLWYIRAALEYVQASGDRDSWYDWLGPICLRIMDAYIRGTAHGIRVSGDGLVTAGDFDTQLTWMDAAAADPATGRRVVFTPRPGKAVEINALWYYELMAVAELVREGSDTDRRTADHYLKLADRMRRSFPKLFWDDKRDCLRDHVWLDEKGEEHADGALRPNQIFAASLPISPLPRTKQVQVVEAVRKHLLTPMGLRTLAPWEPAYQPRYTGGAFERDRAYHQGTVWPWLVGPLAEAVLRVGDFSLEARRQALGLIQPLLDHLLGPGLGQVPEIFEAEPTDTVEGRRHRPVGCPAQAWSVAELLRVLRLLEA